MDQAQGGLAKFYGIRDEEQSTKLVKWHPQCQRTFWLRGQLKAQSWHGQLKRVQLDLHAAHCRSSQ